MLQDVIHPPEQLPTEGISSPIAAQILDFCDDGDIFSETLRNSEVSSCSGGGAGSGGAGICCYDDVSLPSDFSPFSSMDRSALSALLDSEPPPEPEPDIILSGNYPSMQPAPPPPSAVFSITSYLTNPQDQFDATALSEINTLNGYSSYSSDSLLPPSAVPPPLAPPSLPSVFDDDCMLSLSCYMGLDSSPSSTSCSFMAPAMGGAFYTGTMGVSVGGEGLGFYPGSMVVGPEAAMAAQEAVVEYQGESGGVGVGMGIYAADSMAHQRIYDSAGDLQTVFGDNQHLVSGCGSPTPLASDMASLDESTFKVGRLSVEERKEKIHRYLKKRNERNFSKKIKYACRKTLADSRPRVRGRFAKNDDFGEATKPNSNHHEDEDEEEVVIKEEDDMIDTSELYAHLTGMNSFKCNYTLESWI